MTGWQMPDGYTSEFPPRKTDPNVPTSSIHGTLVGSEFNDADHGGSHAGLDIGIVDGFVRAAAMGVVIFAGWFGGYGNLIKIKHPGGPVTWYGHNANLDWVSVGMQVAMGDFIAIQGSTGDSNGNHCHFETHMTEDSGPMDPRVFMEQRWAEEVAAGLTATPGGPTLGPKDTTPVGVSRTDENGGVNLNYWLTPLDISALQEQLLEFAPASGIVVDGTAGSIEYGVMQARLGQTNPQVYGVLHGDSVALIQRAVAATVDGGYGNETNAGMKLSIASHGWGAIALVPPADPQPVPVPVDPVPEPPAEIPPVPEGPQPDPLPETPAEVPDPPAPEIPEENPVTTTPPLTPEQVDAVKSTVADALAKIPEVNVPDGALGSVVTEENERARIYSVTMIIGIVLKMLSAGAGAALAAGFAIWAALTSGIAPAAAEVIAPWVALIVWVVVIFAFISGAYAVWAQQAVSLARANTAKR